MIVGDDVEPPMLGELMQLQALLLQRPHEAFDHPALGLPDVRRRDGHPQPSAFADPGVRRVLQAPVTPERETAGIFFPNPPKA